MTTLNLEMFLFFNQFRGMAPPPLDKHYNELLNVEFECAQLLHLTAQPFTNTWAFFQPHNVRTYLYKVFGSLFLSSYVSQK